MRLRDPDDLVVIHAYMEEYILAGRAWSRRRDVVRLLMRRGYRRRSIHAVIRRLFLEQHLVGSAVCGRPNNLLEQAQLSDVCRYLDQKRNRARAAEPSAGRDAAG